MKRSRKLFRPSCEGMETRQLLSAASEEVVTGLFRQVLLRDPAPQELSRYAGAIDAGATEARVAGRLYNSDEFRREAVKSYYEEILEREPTAAEIGRWSRVLAAGAGEARVVAAIAGSSEAVERFEGDDAAYVRSISIGLLGRQADPAELASYVDRLRAGAPPTMVAAAMTRTVAYRVGKVQEAYQVVLGRLPTAGEETAWASRWSASGGLRGISLRILVSRENAARLRSGAVTSPDFAAVDDLKRILLAPYSESSDGFVNTYNRLLGTNPADDPQGDPVPSPPANRALWSLTKAGSRDGRPRDEARAVTAMTTPVSALTPLQSEVDIDKSLGFALGASPAQSDLEEYLAGGRIEPFGGPILTGGGGRYIVDGHHRWSSLFVINPDAQISALDIGYEETPQDYLKVAQLAVGAAMGYLQVQSVEGQNLFTISRPDFDAWVATAIADGDDPQAVLAVFKQARGLDGIPAIADFLWGNVERMRRGNRPAPGVTGRDYMPQPPSGGVEEMVAWFESGELNSRLPTVARLG